MRESGQRDGKITDGELPERDKTMMELGEAGRSAPEKGTSKLDRREFLAAGGVLSALRSWDGPREAVPQQEPQESPGDAEEIETPLCRLRIDRRNGNLVGLSWKNPSLEVIQEPRLGENFRLAPSPA